MLVRRNSLSVLSTRNRVEIQQDAAKFYPSLIEDLKAARHSIHLQYFIWGVDPFTDSLKEILINKAKAGVEVRLLYDPIGSQAHVGRIGRLPHREFARADLFDQWGDRRVDLTPAPEAILSGTSRFSEHTALFL